MILWFWRNVVHGFVQDVKRCPDTRKNDIFKNKERYFNNENSNERRGNGSSSHHQTRPRSSVRSKATKDRPLHTYTACLDHQAFQGLVIEGQP
jgi:hypothetical protein